MKNLTPLIRQSPHFLKKNIDLLLKTPILWAVLCKNNGVQQLQ